MVERAILTYEPVYKRCRANSLEEIVELYKEFGATIINEQSLLIGVSWHIVYVDSYGKTVDNWNMGGVVNPKQALITIENIFKIGVDLEKSGLYGFTWFIYFNDNAINFIEEKIKSEFEGEEAEEIVTEGDFDGAKEDEEELQTTDETTGTGVVVINDGVALTYKDLMTWSKLNVTTFAKDNNIELTTKTIVLMKKELITKYNERFEQSGGGWVE